MNSWLKAYGLFAGGIIGVGVFSIPAALSRAGVVVFFIHLLIVSLVVWWIQKSFITVVLKTKEKHRLPGYAKIHLGPFGYRAASIANALGLTGAGIAYLIAGSTFLHALLNPLLSTPYWLSLLLYFLPGALLLLWRIRAVPSLELGILILFLIVLVLLPIPALQVFSFSRINILGETDSLFLPYGILLFSFWGMSLIPEMVELTKRNKKRAVAVITASLFTAMISYLFFAFLVVGLSGAHTSEDALTGLGRVLGNGVVTLALIFGVLTTFSSYLALGLTLLKTLMLDYRLSRFPAWLITVFSPLLFVLLGVKSLIAVIALTGAVFLGAEGLSVLAMRWKVKDVKQMPWLQLLLSTSALFLALGVVSELVRILK